MTSRREFFRLTFIRSASACAAAAAAAGHGTPRPGGDGPAPEMMTILPPPADSTCLAVWSDTEFPFQSRDHRGRRTVHHADGRVEFLGT